MKGYVAINLWPNKICNEQNTISRGHVVRGGEGFQVNKFDQIRVVRDLGGPGLSCDGGGSQVNKFEQVHVVGDEGTMASGHMGIPLWTITLIDRHAWKYHLPANYVCRP